MNNKFLLLGKEEGLKEEKINEIIEKARKKGITGVDKFYATDKNDIETFINALSEVSLFGDESILIMANAEALKEEAAKTIAKIITSDENEKFVILLTNENKLSSTTLDKAFSKNERFVFYEMFESQKVPFIKNEARRLGLSINDECANLILAYTEQTVLAFKSALSSLQSYIKLQNLPPQITKEIILDHLSHSKEESGFTILSHLSKRNKENALIALKNAMNESGWNPQTLFPSLIFSLLRIESVAINKEKGMYGDELFSIIGANGEKTLIRAPQEKDTINNFLRNYTRGDISRILTLVAKTEIELRENDTSLQEIILTRMILDI